MTTTGVRNVARAARVDSGGRHGGRPGRVPRGHDGNRMLSSMRSNTGTDFFRPRNVATNR